MVHCEAAAVEPSILGSWTVANDATVGPMKAGPVVDDDMVPTCAPSEETTEGGAIYSCMTCKLELYKSGFLLCDDNVESHDWAGRLWGTCEGCSDYPNRAAFKKAVKNAWKKRAEGTQQRHMRLQTRATRFNESIMWIKTRYPDASSTLRRDLAIARLNVFCLSFAMALEACTIRPCMWADVAQLHWLSLQCPPPVD
jgi:hypothetical protein